jgi:membrane-anchored glycerophosphoryl diester phosphodiesterase (GDPDase)
MRLFLPLLVFGLVALVPIALGFILIIPGMIIAGFITYAAFYLLPLMTDRELGLFDGLQESWRLVTRPPVADHVVLVIIYLAIISIGGYIWFGILITQPLATFIMVNAYQENVADRLDSAERQENPTPDPPRQGPE